MALSGMFGLLESQVAMKWETKMPLVACFIAHQLHPWRALDGINIGYSNVHVIGLFQISSRRGKREKGHLIQPASTGGEEETITSNACDSTHKGGPS